MNVCTAMPEPTPPPITDLTPAREAELVTQCEVKTRELLPPPGEVAEDFIWGGNVVLLGGFLFWDGKDFSAVCRFVEEYTLYWCYFDTRQGAGSCQLRATGMEVKTSPCVVMKITLHV